MNKENNTGHLNTGVCNTGTRNTGNWNTGYWNTGYRNTGDGNTGNWNTGDNNTGDRNTGYRNTGYRNTGDGNTGNWNTGNWNTGDWNTGDRNTGYFCTTSPKVSFFDEETNIGYEELRKVKGILVLANAPCKAQWINEEYMTEKEKEQHKEYITVGGYHKVLSQEELKEKRQKWYNELSQEDKQAILDLPNFDAEKFEKCTLINVNATNEKTK